MCCTALWTWRINQLSDGYRETSNKFGRGSASLTRRTKYKGRLRVKARSGHKSGAVSGGHSNGGAASRRIALALANAAFKDMSRQPSANNYCKPCEPNKHCRDLCFHKQNACACICVDRLRCYSCHQITPSREQLGQSDLLCNCQGVTLPSNNTKGCT